MYRILKDIYYTSIGILVYYFFLKKTQYWNIEKIKDYQFKKLKHLLVESYEGIPYYKKLFDDIGFNPYYHFKTLKDLEKIPVLSKSLVKENVNHFENNKYQKNSILFRTSGSTGKPLKILIYYKQWILEQGVIWRHWKWGGYNFRDSLAMVRSYVPTNEFKLWKTSHISNFIYFSPFHLNDENIKKYLNIMIKKKVIILRGYPSSLVCLANFVIRTKHVIPKIKLILTASEVLTDKDRFLIEKAFRAKVSNHYGLAEQIVMMGDCEKHEGMHNYDEYGYLELLDTDDPQIKRIIGTNLHNLTTPLIRYDTGDLAILANKPCSCGRSLPIVMNIIGRKDSVIKTVEGYEIPTVNFYTMFQYFHEIDRWQIIQKSLTEIEFIIASQNFTNERLDVLKNEITKRLNSKIHIVISQNVNFIQKHEGKINPFIRLF